MARFTGGWIKLWRKAVEGDLADNIVLWGLWNWLLFAATWKPSSIIWKGKRRDIPPGTVVMGISELAEKWDCSPNTIRRWLNYLVESRRITLEVCTLGTLVTICNWSVYQANDAESCTPSENQVITDCKPSENQVTLNEEVKKRRSKEKKNTAAADAHPLLKIWNEHCGTLAKAVACTGTRKKHADSRWSENPSTEYWAEIISRIAASNFCSGAGSTGWRADFDFLIRPDTMAKVLEGKYDDRQGPQTANLKRIEQGNLEFADFDREMEEIQRNLKHGS